MKVIKNLITKFKTSLKADFPFSLSFLLIGLASFLSLIAPFFSFQEISRLVGSTSLSIFTFSYFKGILIMIFSGLGIFFAIKRRIVPSAILAFLTLLTYSSISPYQSTASLSSILNLFSIGGLLYEFLNMETTAPGAGAILLNFSTMTYILGFISYLIIRFLLRKSPAVKLNLGLENSLGRVENFYSYTKNRPGHERLMVLGIILIGLSLFLPAGVGVGGFPAIYLALIRSLFLLLLNFVFIRSLSNKKIVLIATGLNLIIYLSLVGSIRNSGLAFGFGFSLHSLGLILLIGSIIYGHKK